MLFRAVRSDIDQILEYGYAYGLRQGKYIGLKEFSYWSMALPLRRILESKVSKVGNGFYGHFDKMGLYVFCRENLDAPDAVKRQLETLQHDSDKGATPGHENAGKRGRPNKINNLRPCF
ncbi:MAG: hypothetical protein K6E61_07225 [Bacteroidales bacterium]|nr:hypothetical protein [Bacteroidales bacterium]